MNTPIRVMIVDDHVIVREGLRTLLSEVPDMIVVEEAVNGREALVLIEAIKPDVILMDLVMPEIDGIEATRRIQWISPASRVLILTSFVDDQQVQAAIQAGAIGYLLKDILQADLLHAIRTAAQGKPALHPEAQRHLMRQLVQPPPTHTIEHLTERELDVLRLIAQGRSNREIAAQLHLTEGTVKGYVSSILAKLSVADRTQAALYAVRHGLVAETA